MISTGNDMVALQGHSSARVNEVRFYSKIISATEQALFEPDKFQGLSFSHFVWLLWSVKESVYKLQHRMHPALRFSPLRIQVQHIDLPAHHAVTPFSTGEHHQASLQDAPVCRCTVQCGTETFYSISTIYTECIHTIASVDQYFGYTWWGLQYIHHSDYHSQSAAVRSLLLSRLSPMLPHQALTISKTAEGIPLLLCDEKPMPAAISFSHHGHFVGYSLAWHPNHAIIPTGAADNGCAVAC